MSYKNEIEMADVFLEKCHKLREEGQEEAIR